VHFHTKQHLCAGFVTARTTEYVFSRGSEPVSGRQNSEDAERKPRCPTAAQATAAGKTNETWLFFFVYDNI